MHIFLLFLALSAGVTFMASYGLKLIAMVGLRAARRKQAQEQAPSEE